MKLNVINNKIYEEQENVFNFLDKIINILGDFKGGLRNKGDLQTRQKTRECNRSINH